MEVLLKLDDLWYEEGVGIPGNWLRVIEFLQAEGFAQNIGIMGNQIEKGDEKFIEELRSLLDSGNIELWNHGYTHEAYQEGDTLIYEFCGTPFEKQLEHFRKTQRVVKERLNVEMETFGSPCNKTDQNTEKVLCDIPEIKYILCECSSPHAFNLRDYNLQMEYPVHNPCFDKFCEGYALRGDKTLLQVQGHPMSWEDNRFEEFVKIVLFLKNEGAQFIKASEWQP